MTGQARAFVDGVVALVLVACWVSIVHENWHRVADERAALGVFFGVPMVLMLAVLGIDEARRRWR